MIFNSVPHSQNLTDYINDVKPYRTKLINTVEEYVIHDFVTIFVVDYLQKEYPKSDSSLTKIIDYFTIVETSQNPSGSPTLFFAYYDIGIPELLISDEADEYYITHNGRQITPTVIAKSVNSGIEANLKISMNAIPDNPGIITPTSFKFSLPSEISVPFSISVILN